MSVVWINLSTRYDLSSVQAALNVIISVLGTIGIWAFSRYWWQRSSASILRGEEGVPLSTLFALAGPGDGWDVVTVLRWNVFARKNWHLLFQVVVAVAVTLASMFSGPIAKASTRSSRTVQRENLEVLGTIKGDGSTANILSAEVLWNDTIQSLDQASFPLDQMLDYLPPSTKPWTYVAHEWDPTWRMKCTYTPETLLHNVTASGNYTFYDPLNAFPAYRDTFGPEWLDSSKYRIQSDFNGWSMPSKDPPFEDFLFVTLAQSDPEIDDRMSTNNETLKMSVSVFHARNFRATDYTDVGQGGAATWRPVGHVETASYSRVECNVTRKVGVLDEASIPWIWTNDTYSITMSYREYWTMAIEEANTKNQTVLTPTPEDLLRFYQAYMISVNTEYAAPSLRKVSLWKDTVQLSLIFLTLFIFLTSLTLWLTGRYFWFLQRRKPDLEKAYVPDGKIEWMIHAAKTADTPEEEELVDAKAPKDRHHFTTATFGYNKENVASSNGGVRRPSLARVYTSRNSISAGMRDSYSGDNSQRQNSPHPPFTVHEDKEDGEDGRENGSNDKRVPTSVASRSWPGVVVSAGEPSQLSTHEHDSHQDEKMSNPQVSKESSTHSPKFNSQAYSSSANSRLILPETEELSPRTSLSGNPNEKK